MSPVNSLSADGQNKLLSIAALEQMRIRALENLAFEEGRISKGWLDSESDVKEEREYAQRLQEKVNSGIEEMEAEIIAGRAETRSEIKSRGIKRVGTSWRFPVKYREPTIL